jgi:hypothetical protein
MRSNWPALSAGAHAMTTSRFSLIWGVVLAACAHGPMATIPGNPAATPRKDSTVITAAETGFWSDTIRPLSKLGKGWNRIPGRFGTGCAHDSSFSFKVWPGLPEKVLIYLNGGGACWRAQDCDPKNRPTYTMSADSANDVSVRAGIFDVNNEKNPFHDYTIVFVPYCTGDVHLGTRLSEYEWESPKGVREFSVRHGGGANLEAVLDWVFVNIRNPQAVFVAGADAGAIASPVVAEKIARRYARARVTEFGEGAGSIRAPLFAESMWRWGATEYIQKEPGFRSLDSADVTFAKLHAVASRAVPRIQFAQFNSIDDAAQSSFLLALGVKAPSLPKLLSENLDEIRDGTRSFHSFVATGRVHSVLRTPAMYTLSVENVKFIDWFTDLVEGNPVGDVGMKLLAPKKAK